MTNKKSNIRYLSAKIILKILNGSSLRDINFEKETDNNQNISLIKAITFGVLRHYWELKEISQEFLSKKIKNKDQDILILLLIGLYELIYLNSKPFAVINETVEASKLFKKIWAKNLLNACLRSFTRTYLEDQQSLAKLEKFKQNSNHPDWLYEEIKKSWPNEYNQIIKANNNKAPLTLRINTKNINVEEFLELLNKANIEYKTIPGLEHALILTNPVSYDQIPGSDKGYFYIQDAASQLAVKLLDLNKEDLNILDACAAPGGKTSYIMQILNELENNKANVISIDNNQNRTAKITENLENLNLLNQNITIITDDVENIENVIDKKFNKILLDAPCSATGVIRRHPDIKHHRMPDDINELNKIQLSIIKKLWDALEINGELLYCTCSILDSENENIIGLFIQALNETNSKFELINLMSEIDRYDIKHKNIIKRTYGLSAIPEEMSLFDGFYYCKIRKVTEK